MAKHIPQKVFRGLDIGFGHTKFTKSNISADGSVAVGSFPSYAANGSESSQLGDKVFRTLSVLPVFVGSERFLVGEDVRFTADGNARQILESDFYKSNQYKALALGALSLMDVPAEGVVDALVVGLPINVMGDKMIHDGVTGFLQATHHNLPNFDGDASVRSITVRRVEIIPQVAGTLLALADEKDLTDVIEEQINLTIDVG
jgi:PRTRC genetic system protein D